jgi:AraC-like DNA-binding protein
VDQQKAAIYFSAGKMVMISPHIDAEVHFHGVLQITFSLDKLPFNVWTEKEGWKTTTAVIIDSKVPHSIKDFQGWQTSISIMPEATRGSLLKKQILNGAGIRYLDEIDFSDYICMFNPVRDSGMPCRELFTLTDHFIDALLGRKGFNVPLDSRVMQCIRYIQANIVHSISAAKLAKEIFLSEDRFLHLFKEQTGMPLRQYILWQRVCVASKFFAEGRSLKEASYEAGFSDPAHFSRSFAQMTGVAPSVYMKLKDHYQIQFCLPS